MRVRVIIPGRLPTLNEVIAANRTHRQAGARQKRETEEMIGWCLVGAKPVRSPFGVRCVWYRDNDRSDPDNIAAGIKFVLDALQRHGIIEGDGWSDVRRITHDFAFDRENPRVEVTLEEAT